MLFNVRLCTLRHIAFDVTLQIETSHREVLNKRVPLLMPWYENVYAIMCLHLNKNNSTIHVTCVKSNLTLEAMCPKR